MKILHVIECLAPRFGGPVTALKALISTQAEQGHQITVCTTNRDYPGGVLRHAGKESFFNGALQVLYFPTQFPPLRYSRSLARFIREDISNFDIVHIHGLYRFPPTYAAYCARKKNVPHIICPHGALDPYLHNRSTKSPILKRAYHQFFDLANLRGASAIQYATREERDRARHLKLKTSSFVLPHGVEETRYRHLPEKGYFRHLLGVGDAPLVLFLGRLNFVKGLDLLIPAFEKLHTFHPRAHLVIAGPDSNGYGRKVREWARQSVSKRHIHFFGYLEETAVREALTDASMLALPSYTESFGMTVIEAMACSTPVVISKNVHIHREVEQAQAGFVTGESAGSLSAAMSSLIGAPEMAGKMGDAGRQLVMQHYTWNSIIEKLTTEYDAIITREPRNAPASQLLDGYHS